MNNRRNVRAQHDPEVRCVGQSEEDLVLEEGRALSGCFLAQRPGLLFNIGECSAS